MSESSSIPRRAFLRAGTANAFAAPFFVRNLIAAPPSETLRLASFGGGNMAFYTLRGIAAHRKVKLACVAEVDSAMMGPCRQQFGDVKVYQDWRLMLDRERKNIDIACVGTPDHMHAPQVMRSLREGLHVYAQKPLSHDIYEARRLTEFARKKRVVTQMGIHVHNSADYKRAVMLVHAGAIGKIKEVHSWSEKKWGDSAPLPEHSDPVPSTLAWDLWLGVCQPRPYVKGYYHPGNWRKRIDFGTATFGDMGCHIVDPVASALQLTAPISVRSDGPAPSGHNWAIDARIRYVFPGTPFTAGQTVEVYWYDGDERPPKEILELIESNPVPGQGSIFVGTKGVMLVPHRAVNPILCPAAQFKDYPMPEAQAVNHYTEFVEAVLGNTKTTTPFDYSGPLTETVLLGTIATRFPHTTLRWNAAKMKFDNADATRLVRRKYRRGWSVKGLS